MQREALLLRLHQGDLGDPDRDEQRAQPLHACAQKSDQKAKLWRATGSTAFVPAQKGDEPGEGQGGTWQTTVMGMPQACMCTKKGGQFPVTGDGWEASAPSATSRLVAIKSRG